MAESLGSEENLNRADPAYMSVNEGAAVAPVPDLCAAVYVPSHTFEWHDSV
jgi:hypothetical protein